MTLETSRRHAPAPVGYINTCDVAGTSTTFWTYGADSSCETKLLLLHGFRGDHHGFLPLANELLGLKTDLHLVIPDLPGFGASGTLRVHNVVGYARWLKEFLDYLGVRQVAAHSFGAVILAAALAEGAPVEKAALINPVVYSARRSMGLVMSFAADCYYGWSRRLSPKRARALLSNSALIRLMSWFLTQTKDKSLRRWIHGQHQSYFSLFASPSSVREAFESSVAEGVMNYADYIRLPLLVLSGDSDVLAPLQSQEELMTRLKPGSCLEVIRDLGHLLPYEAPDQLARAMKAYFFDV